MNRVFDRFSSIPLKFSIFLFLFFFLFVIIFFFNLTFLTSCFYSGRRYLRRKSDWGRYYYYSPFYFLLKYLIIYFYFARRFFTSKYQNVSAFLYYTPHTLGYIILCIKCYMYIVITHINHIPNIQNYYSSLEPASVTCTPENVCKKKKNSHQPKSVHNKTKKKIGIFFFPVFVG